MPLVSNLPAGFKQRVLEHDLKLHPSVGHCGIALAILCAGWAVHHVREKQCAWRNPSDAPGLGRLGVAFYGESVLTVWSGVQASLTRLGGEEEHLLWKVLLFL